MVRKPEDELIVFVLAAVVVGLVVSKARHVWDNSAAWAVSHQVLIGAKADPLIPIPGLHGAGLDLPRAALAVAALLVVALLAGRYLRNLKESSRDRRQGGGPDRGRSSRRA